ncbi:hypothetical protein Tco_0781861 [Tanacetum coccineum]
MSIVQNPSVVDTSNLQTELEHTPDPLSQNLENEKVELEFQVLNYAKENAHLKATYKNMFDSISVTRAQTKTIINSLHDKLHDTIYENAKLRAQLFDKISEQKDTTKGTSVNTHFCKQLILGKPPYSSGSKLYVVTPFPKSKGLPKIDESHALSKLVTSSSIPTPQESKVVKNKKVIAPGMFTINPRKTSREDKFVHIKKVRASVRTNPITISQPHVITKKNVNSNSNGLSSTGIESTAKTRRSQPRSNIKNDRVPSASKSSCIKNKEVKVEEHHRNLIFSKNKIHMSSECNNIKLAIRNDKSEVVCAMCKQCLITANHDVCVLNCVNDMNSHGKKQKGNVSKTTNQKKHKPHVKKPKKVGSTKRLASPKPSKPRSCLRWSPTGRIFYFKGKIIAPSESESQSDCSNDSRCSKHITENLKLLINFVWKFWGTVHFGNDHVAVILDLEVAFRRNTCFVRNLEGVDLLQRNLQQTFTPLVCNGYIKNGQKRCQKGQNLSTRLEECKKLKLKEYSSLNGPTRTYLMEGLPDTSDTINDTLAITRSPISYRFVEAIQWLKGMDLESRAQMKD